MLLIKNQVRVSVWVVLVDTFTLLHNSAASNKSNAFAVCLLHLHVHAFTTIPRIAVADTEYFSLDWGLRTPSSMVSQEIL